jgi:hypothetical protein
MSQRYLIPRRITQRYEFFLGIGWQEIRTLFMGTACGGAWFTGSHLMHAGLLVQVIPGVLCLGMAYFLVRPLPDGSRLLDFLIAMKTFYTKPRRYLYDWSRDDY